VVVIAQLLQDFAPLFGIKRLPTYFNIVAASPASLQQIITIENQSAEKLPSSA
jgi:hypothetical protein